METDRPLYILDTNILLLIVRNGNIAEYIERRYKLRSSPFRPLISAVSLGELYALADRNKWGEQKKKVLMLLEVELVVLDINRPDILKAFAKARNVSRANGKSLSDNDLWIAATASVAGATLLTTDKDFDALYPEHIEREWIDPNVGKP
ncbi:MAG: type II toxin-antitoxin system VapC family toxin [Bacteroidota bacterium]